MPILAKIVAKLTRHPRYFPQFEWSDKLWTHNVFRFFGMIFGEYYGIRPSIGNAFTSTGERVEIAYTLEALLALTETAIRTLFKGLVPKIILIPQLQLAGLQRSNFFPYRFAIAIDAGSKATGVATSVSFTWSHTCTGSNLLLWIGVGENDATTFGDWVTGVTYNSTSATRATAVITGIAGQDMTWLYYLAAPTTGANTAQVNVNHSGPWYGTSESYTGCSQTGIPDAITSSNATTNPQSSTITIVATGCWVISVCADGNTGSPTPNALITTSRGGQTFEAVLADSNATVSTGVQTVKWNTGTRATSSSASFSPVAAATPPSGGTFILYN